ncbi:MAG TPA: hypothetical protein VK772_00015 [Puia sp.]|jgi:hypothetical protein|nr:hypothetical protein [Puia sp.]
MEGITIFTLDGTDKKILQFAVGEMTRHPRMFENLINVAVAESRKNEKKISGASAKKELKKAADC